MKIHNCIKKAGKALNKEDKDAILAVLPARIKELGEEAGSLKAVDDLLVDLRLEKDSLNMRIEEAGGTVEKPEAEVGTETNDELVEDGGLEKTDLEYETDRREYQEFIDKLRNEWKEEIPANLAAEKAMQKYPEPHSTAKAFEFDSIKQAAAYAKAYGYDNAAVFEIHKVGANKYQIRVKTNAKNKRWILAKEKDGYITLAERDRTWTKWRDAALTVHGRGRTIFSLFDRTGSWSRPYTEAGYNVVQIDIDHPLWDIDIMSIDAETLVDYGWEDVHGVIAAPPCNHFSEACRWSWPIKDKDGRTIEGMALLEQAQDIIAWLKPDWFVLENPAGSRIDRPADFDPSVDTSAIEQMGTPQLNFNPNQYGDNYTKKTKLWGRFNEELPEANVFPAQGSRIWNLTGYTKEQKQERSITPIGFADAFFMANSALSDKSVDMMHWEAMNYSGNDWFSEFNEWHGDWQETTKAIHDYARQGRTPEYMDSLGIDPHKKGSDTELPNDMYGHIEEQIKTIEAKDKDHLAAGGKFFLKPQGDYTEIENEFGKFEDMHFDTRLEAYEFQKDHNIYATIERTGGEAGATAIKKDTNPWNDDGQMSQQILQALGGTGDTFHLAGPANAARRSALMTAMTGKNVPKSKAGIGVIKKFLFEKYGVEGRSPRAREADLEAKLKADGEPYARGQEAVLAPETPGLELAEETGVEKVQRERRIADKEREDVAMGAGKGDLFAGLEDDMFPGTSYTGEVEDLTAEALLEEYDEKVDPEREAQELTVGDEVAVLGDIGVIVGLSGDSVQFRAHRNTDPRGFNLVPKSMVKYLSTPEGGKAAFSKAVDELEPEEIEVGMDKGRMMKLLGEKMYTYSLGDVVIKELIQNSFDAGKAAVLEGLVDDALIDVSIDYPNRTIIIKDNGKGMSAEILKKAFFTIGGTDKSDLPVRDRSGGLGLAKVGFMLNAENLWVRTTQKGSTRAITVFMTTEDIELQRVRPSYEDADINEHGTEVRVKIPESREDSDGNEKSYGMPWDIDNVHFFDKPLIHPNVIVTAKATGFHGRIEEAESVTLPMGKNFDTTDTPKLTNIVFPDWGTAEVYFGINRDKKAQTHVLSAGAYQFSYASELRQGEAIPYEIIVDVRSDVKAEHTYYPFANSRESWSPNVAEDIKLLQRYLTQTALGGEAKVLQDSMRNIVSMPIVTNEDADKAITKRKATREFQKQTEQPELTPEEKAAHEEWAKQWKEQRERESEMTLDKEGNLVDKEGNEVVESAEKYERKKEQEKEKAKKGRMETDVAAPEIGDFMDTMSQDPNLPLFHNNTNIDVIEIGREHGSPEQFFSEIGTIFMELKQSAVDSGIWKLDGLGADHLFFAGVSIDKAYGGVHIKVPYKAVFLNPLYAQWNDTTLFGTRGSMISTMIHELAHQADMGHNQNHNTAMTKIMIHLEDSGMMDYYRDAVLKILDRHSATYKAMREAYDKSSTVNVGKSFKDYDESSESTTDDGTTSDTGDTRGSVQAGKQRGTGKPVREAAKSSTNREQFRNVLQESEDGGINDQRPDTTDTEQSDDVNDESTTEAKDGSDTSKRGLQSGSVLTGRQQSRSGSVSTAERVGPGGRDSQRILSERKESATGLNESQLAGIEGDDPKFSIARNRSVGLSIPRAKDAVRAALGHKLMQRIEFYETLSDVPDEVIGGGRKLLSEAGIVEGFALGKKAYLITRNLSSRERAAWVAWHELWHRGAKIRYGQHLNRVLRRAGTNNTVRDLAEEINKQRDGQLTELGAIDEAMAELNSAMRSKLYDRIEEQYKIVVPQGMRSAWRARVQSWLDMIRKIMAKTYSYLNDKEMAKPPPMSDLAISNMIRGLPLNRSGQLDSWSASKAGRIDPFFSSLSRTVGVGNGMPRKGTAEQFNKWFEKQGKRDRTLPGHVSPIEYKWSGLAEYMVEAEEQDGVVTRAGIQEFVASNPFIIEETILDTEDNSRFYDHESMFEDANGDEFFVVTEWEQNKDQAFTEAESIIYHLSTWTKPQLVRHLIENGTDSRDPKEIEKTMTTRRHVEHVLAASRRVKKGEVDTAVFEKAVSNIWKAFAVREAASAKVRSEALGRDVKASENFHISHAQWLDALEDVATTSFYKDTPRGRFQISKRPDGTWRVVQHTEELPMTIDEGFEGPATSVKSWATDAIGPLAATKAGAVRHGNESYNEPGGENYREILFSWPKSSESGNHYDMAGMFLHVRFDERREAPTKEFPEGRRMVFIQEIQADNHQHVRDARSLLRVAQTEIVDAGYQMSRIQAEAETEPYYRVQDYTMFAMKRMIRWAADNGFNSIGITDSVMQNDRWQNEIFYSELEVSFSGGGTYDVMGSEPMGRDYHINVNLEQLKKKFGEDVAAEAKETGSAYVYDYTDLSDSGRGMVGYYDKIVPNELNKFLKKFNGEVRFKEAFRSVKSLAELHADYDVWAKKNNVPQLEGAKNKKYITEDIHNRYEWLLKAAIRGGDTAATMLSPEEIEIRDAYRKLDVVETDKLMALINAMKASRDDPLIEGIHQFDITEELREHAVDHGFAFSVAPEGQFDREEVEQRWQDASKKQGKEPLFERFKDRQNELRQGFIRHFKHLPVTSEFADVNEQLRKLEAAPDAAKDQVIRLMKLITENMTPKDLDLFTRKIVLDDLSYEITQDHDLPMDLTPEEVHETLARIDAALVDRPDITEAVEARRIMVRNIAQKLVNAGVLTEEQVQNPYYFRHKVLEYQYANSQYGMGPGGKVVKSPNWHGRKGSIKDINVNYLEVEFEWLNKALVDIEYAKTLTWIGDPKNGMNIRDAAQNSARAFNERNFEALLDADMEANGYEVYSADGERVLRVTSPLLEENKAYSRRIAMGLSDIVEGLGEATFDVPERFRRVVESLEEQDGSRQPEFFAFLGWLADNGKEGSHGAKMVFKAINQRKSWKQALLGERYVNVRNMQALIDGGFAGEDGAYVTWQPDKGRMLFTASTITDKVVTAMMEKLVGEQGLSAQDAEIMLDNVRTMLAVGGPKFQMILPAELAATLDELHDTHIGGIIHQFTMAGLTQWKRWQLISPWRIIKYNLNNFSGDIDAVIAIGPKMLTKLPQAIRELRQVMYKGAMPSEKYREAVRRGVFGSALSKQEIAQIDEMGDFANILERQPIDFSAAGAKEVGDRLRKFPVKIFKKMQKWTWYRENWIRYAAYLHYEEVLSRRDLLPSEYGASRPELIDSIADYKDKAAMVARNAVGDYGNISHFGAKIRQNVIPFWSWMEVNTSRYWRIGVNAYSHNFLAGLKSGSLIGATLGVKATAFIGIRAAFLYTTLNMINILRHGDDEESLSNAERARLHINMGHDKDGRVRVLRFQGALSDFFDWVGAGDVRQIYTEIESGRATYGDMMTAVAKAPINKLAGGLTPILKVPFETALGYQLWPDVFNPRRIKDRGRYLSQLFALEHEYDVLMDKPSKGYGNSIGELIWKYRDPGQSAYQNIRTSAYDYLQRTTGQDISTSGSTPRSAALYDLRLSQKYGDEEGAKAAKERVIALSKNRKEAMDAIKRYTGRAAPLAMFNKKQKRAFLATLSEREQKQLKMAIAWHKETFR